MPLPLNQLRAIFSRGKALRQTMQSGIKALRQGVQETSKIKNTMAVVKAKRIHNFGAVEQMGMHAKMMLTRHTALASKRGGSRLATSVSRQNQYVRHVQSSMKKTLKAHKATGPYGKLLVGQVNTAKNLVRRTN